jgi:Rieske Fe-S protein
MNTCTNKVAALNKESATRRSLFVGAIHAIWGGMIAVLGVPAAAYLLGPPRDQRSDEWVDIGDISKLPTGRPVQMVFRRSRADGWKLVSEKLTAWVVRTRKSGLVAFGPQCTHLGCAHHWDEGKNQFVCPCHNSMFSIEGTVLAGPASRPLDRYDIKIEGNKLLLGNLRRCPERVI